MLGSAAVFTVFMVLYLLNSRLDPTAKITWLVVIMLLPVFGALLFWYTQSDIGHRAVHARLQELIDETKEELVQDPKVMDALEKENPDEVSLARYVRRSGCFPVYADTKVTYFPLGEDKFEQMLVQLKSAKKYIFMEYFIVEEGLMWGKILEILAAKVREGVDVRLMYDGTCEFSTLPHNYPEKLKTLGIKCKMFSPVTPFLSTHYNYRDHRKILVIDGCTAFTGGVNLADEYINQRERFGHWKDTAIMLEGGAAQSFALMFLQMWNITERAPEFDKYLDAAGPSPKAGSLPAADAEAGSLLAADAKAGKTVVSDSAETMKLPAEETCAEIGSPVADASAGAKAASPAVAESPRPAGFVLPYGDCPLDSDKLGERVYMDILNRSRSYVHIMSPYLILDGEMETALKFAAEKGVDVKLILPGIPDKPMPYALAKSHYKSLLDSGVKIYEYTPGFVHAKVFVSDDCRAVVGTINLDYRSLYHHFECAAYLYRTECISDIERDFQATLARCRQVTPETVKNEKWNVKLTGFVMKAVAPLL